MSSLHGFLIYTTPNPYARLVNSGRPLYFLDVAFGLGFVTEQEKMIVGTRCGTHPFSMAKVEDYDKYKRGVLTATDIIIKYRLPQGDDVIPRFWFGDSLL